MTDVLVHKPVLLDEVLENLITDKSGTYLDATVGYGGHSLGILNRLNPEGKLIGTDRDQEALSVAKKNLKEFGDRVVLAQVSFSQLEDFLRQQNISQISGFLFDIGMGSWQIETEERGFSYLKPGPLDMRMDRKQSLTAYDIVNRYSEEKLVWIFKNYGEERFAKKIAKALKNTKSEIRTTSDLRKMVEKVVRTNVIKTLARVFQALRIEVNQELEELKKGIETAVKFLNPQGRLAIISYHSLEDRIVKESFRELAKGCKCPPTLPVCICGAKPELKILNKKPIVATEKEKKLNPKSRSAKLRVGVKI